MSPNHRVVSLSAALVALTGPAVLATTADAADTVGRSAEDAAATSRTLKIAVGDELMAFTVGEDPNGTIVADHSSHASHSSHSSHSSHHSSR